MATFFWDWNGVIHLDILQDRRTINAEYHSNILLGDVEDKIRSKGKTGWNLIYIYPSKQCQASHCQKNHGNHEEAKVQPPSPPTLQPQVIFFIWDN